jgi:hypothetical protein
MKTNWCVTSFLLFILCAGVQLHAQQTNADSTLFEETKAKAEKGDADAQTTLGLDYFKIRLPVFKMALIGIGIKA